MNDSPESYSFDIITEPERLPCSPKDIFVIKSKIMSDEIEDASKLATFFSLTHQELMDQLESPDSSLSTCLNFLHSAEAEGHDTFQNIYKICHEDDDGSVYGDHFLIALKKLDEQRVMCNGNSKIESWQSDDLEDILKRGFGRHIKLGQKRVGKEPEEPRSLTIAMAVAMLAQYSSWLLHYLGDKMQALGAAKEQCETPDYGNAKVAIDHLIKEIPNLDFNDVATKIRLCQKSAWLDYFLYRYLLEVRSVVTESESTVVTLLEKLINQRCHHFKRQIDDQNLLQQLIFTPENRNPRLQFEGADYDVKFSVTTKLSPQSISFDVFIKFYDFLVTYFTMGIQWNPQSDNSVIKHKYSEIVVTKDNVYSQPCLCDPKTTTVWLCSNCRTLILRATDDTVCCCCQEYTAGTLHCSPECNVFKMLNLKPHYKKNLHNCKIDNMYKTMLSYNVISAVDLYDGVKVSQFFNLSPDILLKWLNEPKPFAVADCMKYLETKRSEGFTTFVNCVVYCGKKTNDLLCGSQIFIALQESEADGFLRFLGELENGVESDYQCPEGGSFNMLLDFDVSQKKKRHVNNVSYSGFFKSFFCPSQGSIQPHLNLGESGKPEISSNPTPESSRLECFLIGRQVLSSLIQRLQQKIDFEEVVKRNDDINVVLSVHSYYYTTTSHDRREEVTGVVGKLPPLLTQLKDAPNPMAIKEVETSIAELLTVLKHFCFFSKEPAEKSVLLDIQSNVEKLPFKQDSGMWCIVDDGEKELGINGPVIRVPRSKIEEFQHSIGEQKAGLFPIVIVSDAEKKPDVILDLQQPKEQYLLKVIHSTQVNGQPDNSKTFRTPCNGACLCKPEEKSAWICKECQMVLFLTPESVIQCLCNVYDRSKIQCSEDCISLEELNNDKNNIKIAHYGNELQLKNAVTLTNIVQSNSDNHDPVYDTLDDVSDAETDSGAVQLRRTSDRNLGQPISSDGLVSNSIEVSQSQKHHQTTPRTNAMPKRLIVPKEKPIYTVVVTGASGAGKSTLLNSIYCMLQNGTFDNALKTEKLDYLLPVKIEEEIDGEKRFIEFGLHENENEEFSSGQSTTQRTKDYIVEYNDFKICFVDTPGTNDTRNDGQNDQDKINIDMIRKHLLGLDEIHAVVFVVKTTESKLTPDFANTISCMLEMLPQRALENCCFVYTFSAVNPNFTPGPARQALSTFFENFCDRHHLPPLALTTENQFCVDNEAFRNISIHHQGYGISDVKRYRSSWNKTAMHVDALLDRIISLDPVTQKEFQCVKLLNELGDVMRRKLRPSKTPTPQIKMLMATVAETSLSGFAIFCRRNCSDAEPIGPTTIDAAISYWKREDSHVSIILEDLKSYLTKH